jgi:hypothetical protein
MDLVLVNPFAALAAVAVVVPLLAYFGTQRRGRRVRAALRLRRPPRRSGAFVVAAIVVLAGLVGIASAQPVLLETKPRYERTDAEAFMVFDITRSMLARQSPEGPIRLERAVAAARDLRTKLGDVPVGIASFTNRAVPHLFPTASRPIYSAALSRVVAIERPPPDDTEAALVTTLDALAPLASHNFFSPESRRRVAIVLTDGESRPVAPATIRALTGEPPVRLVIVRFWSENERIFRAGGGIDATYETDPESGQRLAAFADAAEAQVFDESDVGAAARAARRLLGTGPKVQQGHEVSAKPLTAWVIGLAFLPLVYLLWRRNL